MTTDAEPTAPASDHHVGAVPVQIVKSERETPPKAALSTWLLAGTEAPFQLLPHTDRRSKATIQYAVALNGSGTAFAYLARRNAIAAAANGNVQSAVILQTQSYSMASFIYESGSGLWIAPQPASTALIISILDEWYE